MNRRALLELRRNAWLALLVRRREWAVAGVGNVRAPRPAEGRPLRAARLRAKRVADVVVTLALLPLVLPLLLLCAAAVRIESPGPGFVSRPGTGQGGHRFRIWRLRTTVDDPAGGAPVPTVSGRFLRATHLDVLPELYCVLCGDMSLVGPRPDSYAAHALPLWYTGRLEAKPGITGLAQISPTAALDPDQSVRLDIAYVRSWTLGLDARILARSATLALDSGGERVRRALDRMIARGADLARAIPSWRALRTPRSVSVPQLGARALVAADLVAVGLALTVAFALRFGLPIGSGATKPVPSPLEYGKLYVLVSASIIAIAWVQQLYRTTPPYTRLEETYAVARAVTLGTLLALAVVFFYRDFDFSRLTVAYFWVTANVSIGTTHGLFRRWLVRRYARGLDLSPTIVVGSPSAHLLDRLRSDPAFGIALIGRLSPNGKSGPGAAETGPGRAGTLVPSAKIHESSVAAHLPRLGSIDDAPAVLACQKPERVIIVEHGLTHAQLLQTIDACERQDVHVQLIPPIYDLLIEPTDLTFINGVPTLRIDEVRSRALRQATKRLLDIVISALLLLLLAPLLIGIAIAIRRTSAGPALFRQTRGGRNGRPFEMLKFRTMVLDAEARLAGVLDIDRLDQPVFKIVDDPRVTLVGRWLRRFSLDELPQLLNVLKGDMTLVGPRPEELRLVQRYDVWQRRRLKMKPGITGLQQVVARGSLSDLGERVRLDIYYTRKQSLLLDLVILARTVGAVLSGRGAT